jgi:hypothetical protein
VDALGVACDDTYLVWQSSTVQNTTSAQPSGATAGLAPWVEFAQGAHVVVRAGLGGAAAVGVQTAANFVQCVWSEK